MVLILKEFPTHVAKTNNKVAPNKFVKINNQAIYSGVLNRFGRAIAVRNIHKYIKDQLKDQDLPRLTKPVQLQLSIFTAINHGDISRRSGIIIWKKPDKDYEPGWDEDNLRMFWEKCIKDVLTELGIWIDDDAYHCRGTNSMVYFIEELSDRRIEIDFKKLDNEA